MGAGEFEATCAQVEREKSRALDEARATRVSLEERLDGARTKVAALAEEVRGRGAVPGSTTAVV